MELAEVVAPEVVGPDVLGADVLGKAPAGRPIAGRTLAVDHLSVQFRTASGQAVRAVKDVSFRVEPGEVVGLVGESGSGKSVTCLSVLRLLPPGATVGGSIRFGAEDVLEMTPEGLRQFRATTARVIFQDPASSLDPLMRVGQQIVESIETSRPGTPKAEARREAVEMLGRVGIADAERRFMSYPHEMSGGMLQRAVIAMALVASPDLLICDEPTTALDVTTEAQILRLVRDLNREFGTSVVFTTHDLGLVREFCDRVIVMYAGNVVETAPTAICLNDPWHPYTSLLIQAEPAAAPMVEGPAGARLKVIEGSPPRPTVVIAGCAFHPRCPLSTEQCSLEAPALRPVPGQPSHTAACWVTLEEGPLSV